MTSSFNRLEELSNACDDFQREVDLEHMELYAAHEIIRAEMVEKYGIDRIEKYELKIKNDNMEGRK